MLAVRVNDTLGLTPGDGVGVGDEARLTSADGVTIASDRALCSRSAGRWVTRVGLHDTSLALTNVSLLTVWVNDTLGAAASDGVGLGYEAGLTGADGIAWSSQMIVIKEDSIEAGLTSRIDITLGPGSAGVWLTWVGLGGATVGATDVAHAAVGVNHALGLAAGDCVGGGGEAGHAATLGVPVPVTMISWRCHTRVKYSS